MENRIVTLIDMDCFYCQVEARLNPSLKGKPVAVVQYNTWMGGGIIAVNYEARDRGVTRHMRGDEAKKHCPEIELVSVPSVRGKADLTKYRDAGREVAAVLCDFSKCVEKASIDEAYIDITDIVNQRSADNVRVTAEQLANTFVVGYTSQNSNDEDERKSGVLSWLHDTYRGELVDPKLKRLAVAALIVEEMRATIYNKTGFRSSAGIAHNKILAKLVCGLHKPNRQTVLPLSGIADLYETLPIKKVRSLGGKLGDDVKERLHVAVMADLLKFSEHELQSHYGNKTGTWLYNIARGIDLEPVTPRLISNSIGCCKKFPGRNALSTRQSVEHWLSELVAEVAERLEEDITMNKRKAQLLTVSVQQDQNGQGVSMSRSAPLLGYKPEKITACAMAILNRMNSASESSCQWVPALKYLGLSASKFIDHRGSTSLSINQFFKNSESPSISCTEIVKDKKNSPDSSACTSQDKDVQNIQNRHNSSSFIGNYFRITNCGSAVRECKEQDTKNEYTMDEEKHKSSYELHCTSGNRINGEVSNLVVNENEDSEEIIINRENQNKKENKSSFFERYLKNKFMKLNDETQKRNGIYIPDEVADCLFPKSDVLNSNSGIIQEHDNTDYAHSERKNIEKSSCCKRPLLSLSNVEIVENEDNYSEKEEEEETVSKYFIKNDNNITTNITSTTASTTTTTNNTTTTTTNNNHNNNNDRGSNSCSSSSNGNISRMEEINQNTVEEVCDSENIDVWISPSEIFPDLDNVDEDTLSLLPSPLRRQVLLKKINKVHHEATQSVDSSSSSNTTQVNHIIPRNYMTNRFSDFSNASSDVEPSTEYQVVASVHVAEDEYLRSLEEETENKGLNLHNNYENIDLNASCIDIFAGIEGENSIHSYKSVITENECHPEEVTEMCIHCGKQILLIDMPEHLDHHVAMDLHKELNSGKIPVRTVDTASAKKKRGRQDKKHNVTEIPRKKFKTISSFFSHR